MHLDRRNIQKILGIITFAILLAWGINNIHKIQGTISYIFSLLFPFIVGLSIAFVLNTPMKKIEKYVILISEKKWGKFLKKSIRGISLILTMLFLVGVVILVFLLIIPQLSETLTLLVNGMEPFFNEIKTKLTDLTKGYPQLADQISQIQISWDQIGKESVTWLKDGAGNLLNSTVSVAASLVKGVLNTVLGLVSAAYVLMQKEKLGLQGKKIIYSVLNEKRADTFLQLLRKSNRTFSNFLSGQCVEAVILGSMFFVTMTLFRFNHALTISIIIGISALIPMFGAFIGCVMGMFLIVIIDPMQSLWFLVLFFVLQQIEGNFIYPKVVGGSVGLPSLWVLVAVTIGGSMFGVVGMLIFIPLFSIIYTSIREFTEERLREKNIKIE